MYPLKLLEKQTNLDNKKFDWNNIPSFLAMRMGKIFKL